MRGLDPRIHRLREKLLRRGMDCRVKPGNDGRVDVSSCPRAWRGHPCLVSSCGKDVDVRDVSAFTRVFRRAMPGHDGGRSEAEPAPSAPVEIQPEDARND